MKQSYLCKLIYKKEIADGIFDFRVSCADMAKQIQPGQFLHIDCGNKTFLRCPISICDSDSNVVRFIFEVKGEGTRELSEKEVGEEIDIMGPLGNAFIPDESEYSHPVIIGGGIGIFPLYKLAKQYENPKVILGFRSYDRVVMEDEFSEISDVTVCTDDGSYGYDGYAVNVLSEYLKENECDIIYSCGPTPMLRAVKKIAEEAGIKCRLSLEQRMGCGIGACLVCSCETIFGGTDRHKRVCKDGPVFWAEEVTLS